MGVSIEISDLDESDFLNHRISLRALDLDGSGKYVVWNIPKRLLQDVRVTQIAIELIRDELQERINGH